MFERLRDELKVNTTCGASNVSFGLPNRNGINSAFLTMAIGAGMTSAITSPLHAEVMQAVLGADVMMGNDPDCQTVDPKYREPSADGETRGRGGRSVRRRRRLNDNERSQSRIYTVGQAGQFPLAALRFWTRHAASAWTSIRSAVVVACVVAARSRVLKATSPNTQFTLMCRKSDRRFGDVETRYASARKLKPLAEVAG